MTSETNQQKVSDTYSQEKQNLEVRIILEVEDLDGVNTKLWTISFTRSIFVNIIFIGLARSAIRKLFEKCMRHYFLRKLKFIERDYGGQ